MKVFLSWSGSQSHKVALVFRDWLPSVIQEIEPYVSSEDIDKGARWSSDIAKELSDSKFGILCVTKENIRAPWIMFEAGALSKTIDKAYVSPFLFDIRRSEVDGPILQFQSTIFEINDLRKLVNTLNKACDKGRLTDERLKKTFDVWYPTLEGELNKLSVGEPAEGVTEEVVKIQVSKADQILEEILDLSRNNQKLIRNSDGILESKLEEMNRLFGTAIGHSPRHSEFKRARRMRKLHPMVVEELIHTFASEGMGYLGVQVVLSQFRSQYPWVYDIGVETIKLLQSRRSIENKRRALERFRRVMIFSFDHPMIREMTEGSREMTYELQRSLDIIIDILGREL